MILLTAARLNVLYPIPPVIIPKLAASRLFISLSFLYLDSFHWAIVGFLTFQFNDSFTTPPMQRIRTYTMTSFVIYLYITLYTTSWQQLQSYAPLLHTPSLVILTVYLSVRLSLNNVMMNSLG